ncbi:hypothetical protein COY26_01185, partial [Candidatus Woesearchaeota archaeon CG_4_10_14_0_2_um_filter_33_10]
QIRTDGSIQLGGVFQDVLPVGIFQPGIVVGAGFAMQHGGMGLSCRNGRHSAQVKLFRHREISFESGKED